MFERRSIMVLDGGMGTELEARGYNVESGLWSSQILFQRPEAVRDVHLAFYKAGADIATTNTYQASIAGFMETFGLQHSEAVKLLYRGVVIANEARDLATNYIDSYHSDLLNLAHCDNHITSLSSEVRSTVSLLGTHKPSIKRKNLKVLRSCGPIGAYLHDGSEYTGKYDAAGITDADIYNFHKGRLVCSTHPKKMYTNILHYYSEVFAQNLKDDDKIGFETIPCLREAKIIINLLREFPDLHKKIWLTFSCRKGNILCSGTPFRTAVHEILKLDSQSNYINGIGVNCTLPDVAVSCIHNLMTPSTFSEEKELPLLLENKDIIVYPNAGEEWDVLEKKYCTPSNTLIPSVRPLLNFGATVVGGCCRVTPEHIRMIREAVIKWEANDNE